MCTQRQMNKYIFISSSYKLVHSILVDLVYIQTDLITIEYTHIEHIDHGIEYTFSFDIYRSCECNSRR
jgi:hypothetical protein